jgi:undecaprenyl-diphosphatase
MLDLVALGALQGLLEWLPVSSKAFVMLASSLVGFTKPLDFAIFLHLGTLIAVVTYMRGDIARLDRKGLRFLAIATAGTALVGVPLYFVVKSVSWSFGALPLVLIGAALLLTGFLVRKRVTVKAKGALSDKDAALAGLAQGFAMIPGVSRSGITLFALLSRGYGGELALKLSFLMSIPAVVGVNALEALNGVPLQAEYLAPLAAAAVVGYVTIGVLLRVARKVDFSWFCWLFGGLSVLGALLA